MTEAFLQRTENLKQSPGAKFLLGLAWLTLICSLLPLPVVFPSSVPGVANTLAYSPTIDVSSFKASLQLAS